MIVLLALAACGPPPGSARLQVAWRWRAPAPASVGMPAGDSASVAFTYGHHRLVHLDGRGRSRWETEHLGLRDVAPLLLPDRIVAATDTGIATFDRRRGSMLWSVDLGDRANTAVSAGPGRLAVTTWDGRLLVLDARSGAVLHTVAVPGDVLGPAAAEAGTAVVSWDDGREAGLAAVDVGAGRLRWSRPVASGGVSSPALVRGLVVVVTGDARLAAFDLTDGDPRWHRPTAGAGSPEAPPFAGPAGVVAVDRLGQLVEVDPADGAVAWTVTGAGAVVRGGPVRAGSLVAVPVDDGRVLIRSGTDVEVLDPPGRVSGVAAGPGATVLVATREAARNEVVAYRPG